MTTVLGGLGAAILFALAAALRLRADGGCAGCADRDACRAGGRCPGADAPRGPQLHVSSTESSHD